MIYIDGVLIEDDIPGKKFSCDLNKCKGACCTFYGEFGAPVLDVEVEEIKKAFPYAKKYLAKKSLDYINENGMIDGTSGNFTTACIDNKDCVFVTWEKGIAFCSLEKAFINGESDFRKPLSCHLFPIRVASRNNGQLYFQEIEECKPAVKKGLKENIPLHITVKDALIRKFGKSWYEKYENYIKFNNEGK